MTYGGREETSKLASTIRSTVLETLSGESRLVYRSTAYLFETPCSELSGSRWHIITLYIHLGFTCSSGLQLSHIGTHELKSYDRHRMLPAASLT